MMKRILVPLDGSQLAERAIPIATRIVRASLGSILFLRVVTTASEFGVYMSEPSALLQESMEEDLAEATDYLAQVRKRPDLDG
ncbi:MAG TPA: universal stress protein [Ktedonosporobacter sp.]|jgi:nucleotide-binding universal stress UspA family protein|nr:universal stress protein [Ktedonosporobacter sp.]